MTTPRRLTQTVTQSLMIGSASRRWSWILRPGNDCRRGRRLDGVSGANRKSLCTTCLPTCVRFAIFRETRHRASARKLLKGRGRNDLRQPACARPVSSQAGPGPVPPRRAEGYAQPRPVRPRLRQHRPHRPAGRPAPRPRARLREPGRVRAPASRRPHACRRCPAPRAGRQARPHRITTTRKGE